MKKIRKITRTPSRSIKRRTADALAIIDRITGDDKKLRRMITDASMNAAIAEILFEAREKAGLTQAE